MASPLDTCGHIISIENSEVDKAAETSNVHPEITAEVAPNPEGISDKPTGDVSTVAPGVLSFSSNYVRLVA